MAEQNPLGRYARGIAIAFEFTGSIVGGAILGWWIDRWLGTAPYAALILTLLGTFVGFFRLVQMLRRFRSIDRQLG